MRCSILSVALLLAPVPLVSSRIATAQVAAAPTPTYDISTVKPHNHSDDNMRISWQPTTYDASNVSLLQLVAAAYGVRDWLVFGLPAWADSARYDINAKVSDTDPDAIKKLTLEQRRAMLATLLKDRFGLAAHTESKIQPVYELTVLPDGSKLKPTPPPSTPADGTPVQTPGSRFSIHNGQFTATAMTIPALCDRLSYQVNRVVVDKTALTGAYDFILTWTPEDKIGKAGDNGFPADSPPTIFTALKEQLGLKLTPAKAPVPTVVIDHIKPPEEN